MKKAFLLVIALILSQCAFVRFTGHAADQGDDINLYMGESKIVSVHSPTRIVIGNPEIADISQATKRELTVAAKSAGSTNLIVWDNFGEQAYKVRVFSEDTSEIKRRIDALLKSLDVPEVYTQASDAEGKVMLLGRLKRDADRARIMLAIGPLKDKIVDLTEIKEEESIVEIDVLILELNKDATKTLGLTWPGTLTLTERTSPGIAAAGTKWSTLFKVLNLERTDKTGTALPFSFSLDALILEGKARILSRPRLACQSGKEAELLVGGEKPTFSSSLVQGAGSSTSIEYKEFGIKLNIKPVVAQGDRIKLALSVEVSDVGEADIIGSSSSPTAKAYPLNKRSASTELILNDGQTLGIGGLIKQKTEEDLRKVPWLADVPVLGAFFRQRVTKTGKGSGNRDDTELFITLTPTIVAKDAAGEKPASAQIAPPMETMVLPQTEDIPPQFASYVRAVQAKITNAAYFPRQAKDAGWEGSVKVNLHLASNGELKGAKISISSGYKILDDAALELARAQAPYPPFPPQIESQELYVDVPIVYKKN